jgi:hypothetical protein
MTKVKIHADTPSEAVIKSASQLLYVSDARKRKIGLKKPSFLSQFDIIAVVGPEMARNEIYMGMLNPLLYVAEIDGESIPFPQNDIQVRALISRMDEDGYVAVVEGIVKHFSPDDQDTKERIKNLAGTPS